MSLVGVVDIYDIACKIVEVEYTSFVYFVGVCSRYHFHVSPIISLYNHCIWREENSTTRY
jgi:hypothetical protein